MLDDDTLSHTEFQAHAPYMGLSINSLTVQQEKLVMLVASGMSVAAAGRAAGYACAQSANVAINSKSAKKRLTTFESSIEKVGTRLPMPTPCIWRHILPRQTLPK